MPEGALIPKARAQTYEDLRRRVQEAVHLGQRRIEEAKVHTYWETGRLIHQHLLLHQNRADYGKEVVGRLSVDLEINRAVLYKCVQFARLYPIVSARIKLTWAHYRALILVEDNELRKNLEAEAVRNGWSSRQLEERIRPTTALEPPALVAGQTGASGSAIPVLAPLRGATGIYRLAAGNSSLVVDLGFTTYLDLTATEARGLKAGGLVRLHSKRVVQRAEDAQPSDLYTYRAEVLRVVDGDTLWMKIYLRPRHWLKEKLRLRGLDCPELDTPAGQAAKCFVETQLKQAVAVTITTTKPDKWDRYLSDIFLETKTGEERFLNQLLLDHGHAARKDSFALEDWDRLA